MMYDLCILLVYSSISFPKIKFFLLAMQKCSISFKWFKSQKFIFSTGSVAVLPWIHGHSLIPKYNVPQQTVEQIVQLVGLILFQGAKFGITRTSCDGRFMDDACDTRSTLADRIFCRVSNQKSSLSKNYCIELEVHLEIILRPIASYPINLSNAWFKQVY